MARKKVLEANGLELIISVAYGEKKRRWKQMGLNL